MRTGEDYLKEKDYYNSLAEKVVYTGAIDEYFGYCRGYLGYRSLRFETLKLNESDYQGNAVVNYTEKSVPFTRIIEHKHFGIDKKLPYTFIRAPAPLLFGITFYKRIINISAYKRKRLLTHVFWICALYNLRSYFFFCFSRFVSGNSRRRLYRTCAKSFKRNRGAYGRRLS